METIRKPGCRMQLPHNIDTEGNVLSYGVYGHVVNGEMERAKNIMYSTFARVLNEQPDC